ncbi:MAG: DUF368 domain-containing protein [Thermoplasmata archaeon]|nr:DUF368 domain-containing protein [Thermoplasmata archaeon]
MAVRDLKDVVAGIITGVVSMLPGASGATVLVIFGLYDRLIADVAHVREKLLKDLRFVLLLLIGIVIGFIAASFGLDFLIENWEIPMFFFFAALIVIQVPDIVRMGSDGTPTTPMNVVAFIVGFAIIMVFMLLGDGEEFEADGALGFAIMFVVGVIFGLSKIAPGISGSTVLLALGLFDKFLDAFNSFDLGMLVPIGLGLLFSVFVLSKGIDYALTNHRKSTYCTILGLTAGSVVDVLYRGIDGFEGDMAVPVIICIVAGIVLGFALNRVARMYASDPDLRASVPIIRGSAPSGENGKTAEEDG